MIALQFDVKVISNLKISKDYYLLSLDVPRVFKDAQPGQFVHIRINDSSEPLLRRPFSIHRLSVINSGSGAQRLNLNILYEVKGKGTRLLCEKRAGDCLNILGPLGRGFDYKAKGANSNIIIAGGAGVAPLVFLAEQLSKDKTTVLIGAANQHKILCQTEFKHLGCDVKTATEDGSLGFRGRVTALFEKVLKDMYGTSNKESGGRAINVYACGPESMLTELAKICIIKKLPLQVSLEEFMGCGIGACLGCAIETKQGYQRVCHDGPVFNAEEIVWRF
jgi:dihydroorotate dehydrogenase electron transfer subunit